MPITSSLPQPGDQARLWNGPAGHAWVTAQALLDQMFQPMEDLLAEAVAAAGAQCVLDIGCGTGATTLAAARRLASVPGGHAIGVDVSAPMIAVAQARAAAARLPARFIEADAQTHAFTPAAFDMLISRFGSMFFEDPVRAFTNLRGAARDGAALCSIVWRSAEANPFMTLAERTAAPLLPGFVPRRTDGPGQFAFAAPAHVEDLLARSGWRDIALSRLDVPCTFPAPELPGYLDRLGPVGVALQQEPDERIRARVAEAVRTAFEPFVHGPEVRFDAACWLVRARAA